AAARPGCLPAAARCWNDLPGWHRRDSDHSVVFVDHAVAERRVGLTDPPFFISINHCHAIRDEYNKIAEPSKNNLVIGRGLACNSREGERESNLENLLHPLA